MKIKNMIIYKISLNDNIVVTPEIRDKIKLMAYLTYGNLVDYESEIGRNILFKDNIVFNELYDGFRERINRFEFEHIDYESGKYEPFMIGDTTFGFTVYDNSITEEELIILINEIRGIIQIDCNYDIEKIKVSDHNERMMTISSFYQSSDFKEETSKKLKKVRINIKEDK